MTSTSSLTQLHSSLEKIPLLYHTAVSIVMLPFSVVLLQQIHCYTIGLLRYYGNATNSLLRNRNCYVTTETPQTHCHATATVTLLWKRHQGPNMSIYIYIYVEKKLYIYIYIYKGVQLVCDCHYSQKTVRVIFFIQTRSVGKLLVF
jgi:hypothetical protein